MNLLGRKTGNAVVVAHSHALPAVKQPIGRPPKPIEDGINGLLLFADTERTEARDLGLVRAYLEAVSVVPQVVAEHALQRLKFKNPRNPFRPSHQDVREACLTVHGEWWTAVGKYFCDPYSMVWSLEFSPPPFERDCLLSDELVAVFLSEYLSRRRFIRDELGKLSRARFERIPRECFESDEQFDAANGEIKRRDAEDAARKRHEEYMASLDPVLRAYRNDLMTAETHGYWRDKPEEDLIAQAHACIQRDQKLRAALKALDQADRCNVLADTGVWSMERLEPECEPIGYVRAKRLKEALESHQRRLEKYGRQVRCPNEGASQ